MIKMSKLYEVGSVTFSITDDSRKEILGDANGGRKIAIRLYYPVRKECVEGLNKACYVSERKLEAIRKAFHLPKSAMKKNEADYYENVPFEKGVKYPLLLFSHGYNSYIEANTFLCSDIAASGYIVASVGHAYEAVENEYSDGSYDYYDKKINKMMYKQGIAKALFAQSKIMKLKKSLEETDEAFWRFQTEHTPYIMERVEQWKEDMLYALKSIKERYGDYIDFTNGIAASGHSLGGATAYYLCQTCDEVTCGLNIDGGLFGDYRRMVLKKPFYQFSCKENWNVESSVLLRREAPIYTAVFSNMKHIGFTDIKFFMSNTFLVGKMDKDVMYKHLSEGHISFLDKYLKGLDVNISQSSNPDVAIETHI